MNLHEFTRDYGDKPITLDLGCIESVAKWMAADQSVATQINRRSGAAWCVKESYKVERVLWPVPPVLERLAAI